MMKTLVRTGLVAICCAATTPLASQELGSITFQPRARPPRRSPSSKA